MSLLEIYRKRRSLHAGYIGSPLFIAQPILNFLGPKGITITS